VLSNIIQTKTKKQPLELATLVLFLIKACGNS
jgi:hypothetical protein